MKPIAFAVAYLLAVLVAAPPTTIVYQRAEALEPEVEAASEDPPLLVPADEQGNNAAQIIEDTFHDAPVMLDVASCESHLRQYDENGETLKGKLTPAEYGEDLGLFQINTLAWGELAEDLEYDLETMEGNIKMARHIYDNHGTTPWNASRKCWSV